MTVLNGLLLLYPLAVHAAIVTGSRWLELAALAVLAASMFAPWLLRRNTWAWAALVMALAASAAFVWLGAARLFLYAAPVLVPLALLWFFARTLLPGQVPLITRIAEAVRGPLPEPVRRYTRQVTQFWVVAFSLFALANLGLALFAPPALWSLFANAINYLLVGVLLVAEWLFRCWYLRAHESLTWREYIRALARIDYRRLLARTLHQTGPRTI